MASLIPREVIEIVIGPEFMAIVTALIGRSEDHVSLVQIGKYLTSPHFETFQMGRCIQQIGGISCDRNDPRSAPGLIAAGKYY